MSTLMYALACALGLAFGWFGYDVIKAAWMAVSERRRYMCSRRSSMPVPACVPESARLAPSTGAQPPRQ